MDNDSKLLNERIDNLEKKIDSLTKLLKSEIDKNQLRETKNDVKYWHLFKRDGESIYETKLRFFSCFEKATGILGLAQTCEFKILKRLTRVFEDNKIDYWINYGTLIGAIRHGGFIPWDDDIDLCILRDDLARLKTCLANDEYIEVKDYYGYKPDGLIHYVRVCFKQLENCFVDLFVHDYVDYCNQETLASVFKLRDDFRANSKKINNKLDNKAYEKLFDDAQKEFSAKLNSQKLNGGIVWSTDNFTKNTDICVRTTSIFPLQKIKFCDIEVMAPNKALNLLKNQYGDFLSLPNDLGVAKHFTYNQAQLDLMEKIAKDDTF